MPKVIDDITMRATGVKKRRYWPATYFEVNADPIQSMRVDDYAIEYEVKFQTCVRFTCKPEEANFAKRNAVNHIREYIYGDLRDDLLELEMMIYDGKELEACKNIRKIIKDCFD